jgi:hypothetical protein
VHDVTGASEALAETAPKAALEALTLGPMEACSDYRGSLVACKFHPLVQATWKAFDGHRPLVLSPDIIWLTIAQGVALHVTENAELLRRRFVSHHAKKTLSVRRDDFVKGSPENPWGEVIDEFSRQIAGLAGPMHGLIVSDFSTTGSVERVASEVVLMDSMQSYFKFDFYSLCGIPSVTLEGTPEDWRAIRGRLDRLDDLDLSWWTAGLKPILDQFVRASTGTPDREFWRSIFKVKGESGGPYLTGWLVQLFPYLQSEEYVTEPSYRRTGRTIRDRNPYLKPRPDEGHFGGVTAERLPGALSRIPFRWHYQGEDLDYEFVAGLIGIRQDRATTALHPEIGWAVRPAGDVRG